MHRIGHGLIVLAITLAVAGAIATSAEGGPAASSGGERPSEIAAALAASTALRSEVYVASGPRLDIPIRSGRLSDEVITEKAQPVSVRVAGIGLEASVLPVGVDGNSQFAVPSAATVGWYQHSASPGAPGASVLAAHVDYGGEPGAFFNLAKVLPGETLEVEMEDGAVILYEVTGNTIYDKRDLPAGELFRKDGDSVLQLITCGGTFNPSERSYEANVVVTAVPLKA